MTRMQTEKAARLGLRGKETDKKRKFVKALRINLVNLDKSHAAQEAPPFFFFLHKKRNVKRELVIT